jgi:hypothetical protein
MEIFISFNLEAQEHGKINIENLMRSREKKYKNKIKQKK